MYNMITKFDMFNESVRDMMKPISDDKIKELRNKGKFSGRIKIDGYTERETKAIIKRYSKRLNHSFHDDTDNRVVDWLYEWKTSEFSNDPDFSDIRLTLSSHRGKYTIDFTDNRIFTWKNIKTNISSFRSGSDFQFTEDFDLLEDALGWLSSCGIDTSKITRT